MCLDNENLDGGHRCQESAGGGGRLSHASCTSTANQAASKGSASTIDVDVCGGMCVLIRVTDVEQL